MNHAGGASTLPWTDYNIAIKYHNLTQPPYPSADVCLASVGCIQIKHGHIMQSPLQVPTWRVFSHSL